MVESNNSAKDGTRNQNQSVLSHPLHVRIKHHVHRHLHRHAHHVSHALAYHFETLHHTLLVVAFAFAFVGNALFAATSFANIKSNTSLIYPLKQVSTFACRQLMKPRSELDDSCKVPLPIIVGAKYDDYKDNTEERNMYTVLRGATYP